MESCSSSNVIITGDFNLPGLYNTTTPNSAMSNSFKELINTHALAQIITSPSHCKGNILDLCLTNCNPAPYVQDSVTGFSDHTALVIALPHLTQVSMKADKTYKKLFLFDKTDFKMVAIHFESLLSSITTKAEDGDSTQSLWAHFKDRVLEASRLIPTKTIKCTKKKWISKSTIQLIRKRRRVYHKYIKYKDSNSLAELNQISKAVKNKIKHDYNHHLKTRIANQLELGNTKPLFRFISDKKKSSTTQITRLDGCLESDSIKIADTFAEAFSKVFTKDDGELPEETPLQIPISDQIEIFPDGVASLISNLDTRKSCGPDNISIGLLKCFSHYIVPALSVIMQHSLDTGGIPDDWKHANVVPIYKKGSKTNPLNYRPISLTSITSKILEHIISTNLRHHLDNYKIITNVQHGFRSHHSCESQLLTTFFDIAKNHNDRAQTDVIALDFAKAFDTVSHKKLIHKLRNMMIHPSLILWIQNWLCHRSMSVVVEGKTSSPVPVTSGVPQGSVLGPLLFILFINDLPTVVKHASVRLYADDTLLYCRINSISDCNKLQKDLDSLADWVKVNQLMLNASKCVSASFNPVSFRFSYSVDGRGLESVNSFKYLGVTLSSSCNFNEHITSIANKACRTLYMLMRAIKMNYKIKAITYKTIVRPILEYAAVAWSPYKKKEISLLESVQRKAFRWTYKLKKRDQISNLMKEKGWTTLEVRRSKNDRKTFYKIKDGLFPFDLDESQTHSHNTRSGITRMSARSDVFKYFFTNRIVDYL